MPSHKEYLIIGQGLAGTLLALELRRSGLPFRILEGRLPYSGSAVAAGILNPATGKRLAKSWRFECFIDTARQAYREWEELLGEVFFRETRLLRLFQGREERKVWERKKNLPEYVGLLGESHPPGRFSEFLRDEFGSFEIQQAAVLDVQELLKAAKQLFDAEGSICKETFRHEDLQAGPEKVVWKNKSFGTVMFCEGFRVRENPWFGWIPMEPARGEIQTIRAKNSLPEGILNRGKWLKPTGNGIYQAGATYSWDQLESKPNALGLQEMQTGLESMVHQRLEVLERKIGVRPATKDRRPVAGFHPEYHCLGILNGLGAKGSLMGPWLARHLVEVMRERVPINQEVDVRRFPLASS